jgi:hypothetical protein
MRMTKKTEKDFGPLGQCTHVSHENCYAVRCYRPAKMKHEGHGYCGTHDPLRKAARNAAKRAEWDAAAARQTVRRQLDILYAELAIGTELWVEAEGDATPDFMQKVVAKIRVQKKKLAKLTPEKNEEE